MVYDELLTEWKDQLQDRWDNDPELQEEYEDFFDFAESFDYVDEDFRSAPDRNYRPIRIDYLDEDQWRKLEQYFMTEIHEDNYEELLLQFLEDKLNEIDVPV